MSDKLGPKIILLLTVVLMGIVTFCMELLPTYAALGVGAPITSANGVHTVQITEYVLVMLLAHVHHLPPAIVCRNGQSGPAVSTSLGY